MLAIILSKYLGMEWLDHLIGISLSFQKLKYCFPIACITYIPTSSAWWFQFLHILEIKLLAWLISLLKALGDKIFFQNHLFSWQNLVPCRFRAEFSFTCCVQLLGATCIPCHVPPPSSSHQWYVESFLCFKSLTSSSATVESCLSKTSCD